MHGIGGVQHFAQDLAIGLELGWGGIGAKITRYREVNRGPRQAAFYEGLEQVLLGTQEWIGRHAAAADGGALGAARDGGCRAARDRRGAAGRLRADCGGAFSAAATSGPEPCFCMSR